MKQILALASVIMLFSIKSYSQHEGTLTQSNVRIGNCTYSSVSVKYRINSLMGEPTVNGVYKVNGPSDCKLPYSTVIWLKIKHPQGGHGYIKLNPTVPKVNSGYGFNATGSPDWDSYICGYDGTRKGRCFSESDAKRLYKEGRIVSFEVAW